MQRFAKSGSLLPLQAIVLQLREGTNDAGADSPSSWASVWPYLLGGFVLIVALGVYPHFIVRRTESSTVSRVEQATLHTEISAIK